MPVKLFRKKPVVIEAIQYTDKTMGEVLNFIGRTKRAWSSDEKGTTLFLDTLEGGHIASQNDWIIKGIKGEFYPCKPDIFEQTYEEEGSKAVAQKDNNKGVAEALRDEKTRIIEIIKAEPEFPGEMPKDMFEKINNNKSAMTEALRLTVKVTKQNILKKLLVSAD